MKPLLKITTKPIKIAIVKPVMKSPTEFKVSQPAQVTVSEMKKHHHDHVQLTHPIHPQSERSSSTQLSVHPVNEGQTSAQLIIEHLSQPHVPLQVTLPTSSAAKYEPAYVGTSNDYDAQVVNYQVEQYNEITFEYTGDFIRVPHRPQSSHKE